LRITLTATLPATLSIQHCLQPPVIGLRLRHSKQAAEISTICGTTAASLLLQNFSRRVQRRRFNHGSNGKSQCAV
jgi:hypothetical protein